MKQTQELPSCSKSEGIVQNSEALPNCDSSDVRKIEVENTILKAELEYKIKELEGLHINAAIKQPCYSVSNLGEEVLRRIETGLPGETIFQIAVRYVERHMQVIKY